MKAEYALGGLLVLMGAVQIWLRWGPWAKEQQEANKEITDRRAEAAKNAAECAAADEGASAAEDKPANGPTLLPGGSRLWNKWTAILGPLGIAFGVALIIWGAVGA